VTNRRPEPADIGTDERRLFGVVLELRDAQAIAGAAGPFKYLEGRAVPYDTWADVNGFYLEQHAAGSLERSTKSGAGKAAPLLLWHDNQNWPIGHAERWHHDAGGADAVWRLNGTVEAQKAAALAEAGDLTGLSIGFQSVRREWQILDDNEWDPSLGWDHMDRVTRLESRLVEVSLTPTPAFETAGVTLVRSSYHRERVLEADSWRAVVDGLRSR
jgi:HK97 family phage prohead protease